MKKNKILLVEDNEGDIVLTSEAFEECSCKANIQVARNGKEAINILFDQNEDAQLPDLILLDINLPLLNGHEVLKKIKENEKTQHVPVAILTTSSAISDINLRNQVKDLTVNILKEWNGYDGIFNGDNCGGASGNGG